MLRWYFKEPRLPGIDSKESIPSAYAAGGSVRQPYFYPDPGPIDCSIIPTLAVIEIPWMGLEQMTWSEMWGFSAGGRLYTFCNIPAAGAVGIAEARS